MYVYTDMDICIYACVHMCVHVHMYTGHRQRRRGQVPASIRVCLYVWRMSSCRINPFHVDMYIGGGGEGKFLYRLPEGLVLSYRTGVLKGTVESEGELELEV